LLFAAAVLLPVASRPLPAQGDPLWRAIDLSRQLRDSLPQRIRVKYDAGKIDVRGTNDPVLYALHLRYDETRHVPLHRHDAEQHNTLLGLESRGSGRHQRSADRDEPGELRLLLPRDIPLDLDVECGGTRSVLDLGGLALQSLRLECGATDANLDFSAPNRVRMHDMEINVGAAELTAVRLANANADQLRLRGGVGVIDLDFGGTWTRDMTATTRLVMGKLIVRVPTDVGVRLEVHRVVAGFEHEGFEKRDDAWYSTNWERAPHRLRLRAEAFLGKIDVRRVTR
jgi:hypothetical protein